MAATRPAPAEPARERALTLLARREYGRRELAGKLRALGYPEDEANTTVDALAEAGLQSDARFAEALIRRRMARGYGPAVARRELGQRRVDDTHALDRISETAWLAVARQAVAKRFGEPPLSSKDADAFAACARFLARRGFPSHFAWRLGAESE